MEDLSYKRYRKYRANQHQYKVDQVGGPILMMLLILFITKYGWIIALVIVALIVLKRSEKKHVVVNKYEEMSMQSEEIETMNTTEKGFVNKNNQRNNGKTEKPGTDFGQWFYDMECLDCGHKYYANGSDIWQRKCPCCQGGRP